MQQKRLTSSAAAAIIGGNDDLLMEILVLLPPKPLARFRIVSKQLRSLIDDESFHHRHYLNRRRRRPQHQFILPSTASSLDTFLCDLSAKTLLPLRFECQLIRDIKMFNSFESEYRHVKVLQSSHGLLLLELLTTPRGDRDIYVYNRVTAKRRLVSRAPARELSRFWLMYDPSKSHHYTVIASETCNYGNSIYADIDVYDSRTHKWESKGKLSVSLTLLRFPHGVLCNGRLYFIRSPSPSMCFSPDNLQISAVANPPRCLSLKKYVVESNGRLHYLVLTLKNSNYLLNVYEMTIDDKCWVISKRVDSERPLSATFGVEEIEVLGFVRGEEEEDSILVYHVPGKIMIYRFRDEVSEEIVDFSNESYFKEGSLQFEFKDSYQFIDSFASV